MAIKAEVKDMLAVKGIYSDGKVLVNRKLPVKTAEVIVVFLDKGQKGTVSRVFRKYRQGNRCKGRKSGGTG